MTQTLPAYSIINELVQFQSGPYRLEGELLYLDDARPCGAIVLANPHPLLGGDMTNNVIRHLGDGLAERDWAVLRFNYRGVGASEGPVQDTAQHLAEFVRTSHVPDEFDLRNDVDAAIDFVRSAVGRNVPMFGIGYSFGCALLPRCQLASQLEALILISPTVTRHDYTPLARLTEPKLVIASDDDFATDSATLRDWFASLPVPKRLILERFDNHFFRGHETWLVEVADEFLSGQGGAS